MRACARGLSLAHLPRIPGQGMRPPCLTVLTCKTRTVTAAASLSGSEDGRRWCVDCPGSTGVTAGACCLPQTRVSAPTPGHTCQLRSVLTLSTRTQHEEMNIYNCGPYSLQGDKHPYRNHRRETEAWGLPHTGGRAAMGWGPAPSFLIIQPISLLFHFSRDRRRFEGRNRGSLFDHWTSLGSSRQTRSGDAGE